MATHRITSVIDTNVFLGTGDEIFHKLSDRDFVIPIIVYKEIERYRTDAGGLGKSARTVIRFLDDLRESTPKKNMAKEPVAIPGTTNTVRIELDNTDQSKLEPEMRNEHDNDTIIMAVSANLAGDDKKNVELITNDAPLRFITNVAAGVKAVSYNDDSKEVFTGKLVMPVSDDDYDSLDDEVILDYIKKSFIHVPANVLVDVKNHEAHTYYLKRSHRKSDGTFYDSIEPFVSKTWRNAGPVKPKNMEQAIATELLNDSTVQVVSLGGVAGAGKSLLPIAYGLDAVKHGEFSKITVFRSMYAVGRQEQGFLKGDADDKMRPWAQAVWDSVRKYDSLLGSGKKRRKPRPSDEAPEVVEKLEDKYADLISIEPITYLRGRTLENQLIIVDDAQSLDRSILLDIMSRLGQGSKIVFTFDIDQQDNPYLSKGTSIISLISILKENPLFAHVDFVKSERSELAQLASKLLSEL